MTSSLAYSSIGTLLDCLSNMVISTSRTLPGPEWLYHMRKMIDALAEGHTLEAYIQSVLEKPHTKEV